MGISTSIYDAALTALATVKTYLGTDEKQDEEPVHDVDTNIGATIWNTMIAGLAEVAKRTRPGNLVPVYFEVAASVQSATTPIPILGSTMTQFLAMKDAELVGITAYLATALTAGQVTIQPTINGVNTALSLVITSTDQAGRVYQLPAAADATDKIDASALLDGDLEVDAIGDGTFAVAGSALTHVVLWLNVGETEAV